MSPTEYYHYVHDSSKVLLLICHSSRDRCHLCDTFGCTNTSTLDRPNEETNKKLKGRSKNKKARGSRGVGATFFGRASALVVPACQAQICSLAKKGRLANAWLHLTTVIITVATHRILFKCWHGAQNTTQLATISDDMTFGPSPLLRSGSGS